MTINEVSGGHDLYEPAKRFKIEKLISMMRMYDRTGRGADGPVNRFDVCQLFFNGRVIQVVHMLSDDNLA